MTKKFPMTNLRHGHASGYRSPTYACWNGILQRAGRKPLYLDRPVCERWRSFDLFLADMGERPGPGYSIERIDNAKGYEPDNCRWATAAEQQHNRRDSLVIDGVYHPIAEWLVIFGVTQWQYYKRRRAGLTREQALKGDAN